MWQAFIDIAIALAWFATGALIVWVVVEEVGEFRHGRD